MHESKGEMKKQRVFSHFFQNYDHGVDGQEKKIEPKGRAYRDAHGISGKTSNWKRG